ncbi:hypothetical protein SAMN04488505_109120 [Chitinophaga rupis]|uniref:Uncharacterized protein n=1 Tax=Chitinophaga rupis TaxID=573321 RepID=A0A1H8F648_9BACT|nr:hypothetical protein [Chitinophaga rupis]SEN27341.1 hypothetical protein SAMN04488505_109120 [Chitinophaga rupis]
MNRLKYFKKEGESADGKLGYFYLEFDGDYISKQIEVYEDEIVYLDIDHPIIGNHMLGDQPFEFFDYSENEFISAEDFYEVWNKKK